MASEQTRKRTHGSESDDESITVGKIKYYPASTKKKFSKNPTTTNIFRGVFENATNVFIRRFQTALLESNIEEKKEEFKRDIELLRLPERTSHMHENFTRYFCCEQDEKKNFCYVAIEWCICSVEDLYVRGRKGYDWYGNEIDTKSIKESLKKKEILRQATKGVAFLHAMGFVHRNLKPSNFLIAQIQLGKTEDDKIRSKYLVKVSDFRMSKDLVTNPEHSGQKGSDGWNSPYPRPKNVATDNTQGSKDDTDTFKTHPTEDVFILGCFFHYVLTDGKHPFGSNRDTRIKNINTEKFEVYSDANWTPFKVEKGIATSLQDTIDYQAETEEDMQQAVSLIKDMLKFNPEERPALKTILDRPYFLPDDYYKLYDLPGIEPGLCVIFNQEIFDKREPRKGTQKDLEVLTGVFTNFGFIVEPHKDLWAQQLCDEIKKLSERDFSKYACLVVCILSHGGEGTVCGTEDQQVSIEDAKKQFNNLNCPTLRDKPKIWIIQACQGDLDQHHLKKSTPPLKPMKTASDSTTQTDSTSNTDSVSHGIQPIQSQPPPDIPRPPVSDILDIRATVPGFVSYRDRVTGTWLIQDLCEQLRTFLNEDGETSNRHLEDLLKMVQKSISSKDRVFKQTIEWRSTLINFIRFEKGKEKACGEPREVETDCKL